MSLRENQQSLFTRHEAQARATLPSTASLEPPSVTGSRNGAWCALLNAFQFITRNGIRLYGHELSGKTRAGSGPRRRRLRGVTTLCFSHPCRAIRKLVITVQRAAQCADCSLRRICRVNWLANTKTISPCAARTLQLKIPRWKRAPSKLPATRRQRSRSTCSRRDRWLTAGAIHCVSLSSMAVSVIGYPGLKGRVNDSLTGKRVSVHHLRVRC
jgi:hypothetical protein